MTPTAPAPSARRLGRAAAVATLVVAVVVAPVRAQESTAAPDLDFAPVDTWAPEPPPATAESFLLVDVETGQELAARGADDRRNVASTVKVLTALTALDVVRPEQLVTVGQEVAAIGGAGVGLAPGDTWTVQQLLEGVMVRSGNDAAIALATHAGGGDVAAFVDLMRAKATELGIEGATIEDPTGLDDTNRLSARDLAVVGRAALDDPLLAVLADVESVTLPGGDPTGNRNLLLERRDEVTGLKTGFTEASGYCLLASLETDDGREVLAVLLGARSDAARFDESLALLDFGDDDLEPLDRQLGLRVRRAGGWDDHTVDTVVSVPAAEEPTVLAELDGTSLRQEVVAEGRIVATVTANHADPAPPAGAGAALVDGLYDAMRAAHDAGTWSELDG